MKKAAKTGSTKRQSLLFKRVIAVTSGPIAAIAYWRAAQRDEKNGYELTAALEWRKAAELMAPIPSIADRCWQQWERIMHLPRRLAEPIPCPVRKSVGAPPYHRPQRTMMNEDATLVSAA